MPDPQAPGHVDPPLRRCLILLALLFSGHALADQMPKPPAIEPVATFERPLLQRDDSMGVVELADGKLLLFGGRAYGSAVSARRSEILDPTTLRFEAAGTLQVERRWSRALRLSDGRVVVAGGAYASFDLNRPDEAVSAPPEVWDPQHRDWSLLAGIEIGSREGVLMAEQAGELVFLLIDAASTDTGVWSQRAFRWTLASGRIDPLAVPPASRRGGLVTQLGDGRVLWLGGEALPENRPADCVDCTGGFEPVTPQVCRLAPALVESLAGLPELDWRRGSAAPYWPPGPSALDCQVPVPPSELWDPATGRVDQLAAPPRELVEDLVGGIGHPLANGDLLVQTQLRASGDQPVRFRFARWSAASDRWQRFPGFEVPAYSGWQGQLLEAPDGSFLRLRNRLHPGDATWTDAPGPLPSGPTRLIRSARGELLAVATRAPFVARHDAEHQRWEWAPGVFVDGERPVSLALPDGRLAVWNLLSLDAGRQIWRQEWDPATDRWQRQAEPLPPNPRRLEAALLPTDEVLLIAHYEGGAARCRRWNPRSEQRVDCGPLRFDATPQRDSTGQARPAADAVLLAAAADGRLLLVRNHVAAELYDHDSNRWQSVELQATGQLLLEGRPVRTPEPYYQFTDPLHGTPVDASAAVLRQRGGEYGGYRAELLWDPQQQQWAHVAVGKPLLGHHAVWLPDGCAIGVAEGRFRLLDPTQSRISELGPVPFHSTRLAALPDGTLTLIAEHTRYLEREASFFHRRASCAGFNGDAPPVPVHSVTRNPSDQAVSTPPPAPAPPSLSARLSAAHAWLIEHPVVPLALMLPVLAVLLLRGLQRRWRAHDRRLRVPRLLAIGIRVGFYGALALLLIPQLLQLRALLGEAPATAVRSPDRPCRFTGYWTAQDPQAAEGPRWRYFLGDDGELTIWRLDRNHVATDVVLQGHWRSTSGALHWISDSAPDQTNRILADVGQANGLLLQRTDGSLLRLHLKAPPFSTQACSP